MHCATSLDMEQSECQNSFEHTFFSPCSRISCLNKDTRNPIFCSFLHYDNQRNSTRGGRRQCQKFRYRWQEKVSMAASRSSQAIGGLEPNSTCIKQQSGKHLVHHMSSTQTKKHTFNSGYLGVFNSLDPGRENSALKTDHNQHQKNINLGLSCCDCQSTENPWYTLHKFSSLHLMLLLPMCSRIHWCSYSKRKSALRITNDIRSL